MRVGYIVLIFTLSSIKAQNGKWKTEFTSKIKQFSGDMFSKVLSEHENNTIFSPLSVYLALGLLLEGSNGNTKVELMRGMELRNTQLQIPRVTRLMKKLYNNAVERPDGPTLKIANAIFLQEDFNVKQSYLDIIKTNYRSSVDYVNFMNVGNSVKRINDWVENNTDGEIKNLINSDMIGSLTRAVLVNAIYFKAEWQNKFENQNDITFYLPNATVKVPAMNKTSEFGIHNNEKYKLTFLSVPYKSSNKETATYFVIGLPTDADGKLNAAVTKDGGLSSFENNARLILQNMDPSTWNKQKINLIIPKFQIAKEIDAKSIMEKLGIKDIFNAAESDLSGIANETLFVSDFIHKAYIKVDEEGSVAAGVTGAVVSGRSTPTEPLEFLVDQPFVFGIYNKKAGVFTFLGKVNIPQY